jgi:hypothetical protein
MPINSLVLSRPPVIDKNNANNACSFVFSAYWVEGSILENDVQTVPADDINFWMGRTQLASIGGKEGQLLGRVVMTERPEGTLAIPVIWTPTATDVFGSIYIIVMPVDVTSFTDSSNITGYISIGGNAGANITANTIRTGASGAYTYVHKGGISVGTGTNLGQGVWRPTVTLSANAP